MNIARRVATANQVSFAEILTAPYIDPDGTRAIEIKFVLTPGSSASIMGEPSARTVSQVIRELADKGSGSPLSDTRKRVPPDPNELLQQADALAEGASATQADFAASHFGGVLRRLASVPNCCGRLGLRNRSTAR
jgi:hypothetical protein